MFRIYSSFEEKIKNWGKQQQQLPSRNEEMKRLVISIVKPNSQTRIQKPKSALWFKLSMVGVSVFALIVVFDFVYDLYTPAYNTSNIQTASGHTPSSLKEEYGSDDLEDSLGGTLGASNLSVDQGILYKIAEPLTQTVDKFSAGSAGIDDTREFLKTDYSVSIKTRHVEKMATRFQTIIRGYGGRIDEVRVDEKYGLISFVIPKKSLDQFSFEIQDMIRSKFLTEYMNSENLLPEKQVIEQKTSNTQEDLKNLETRRQELTDAHSAQVKYLQGKLNTYGNTIYQLKHEQTTSTEHQAQIAQELSFANNTYYSFQQKLNKENSSFQYELNQIDTQIASVKSNLDDLNTQDQDLITNVETVEGTISLEWISIFAIINLYVSIYWMLIIVIVLIILYSLFGRKRYFETP